MKKRRILSWMLLICMLCTSVAWAEEAVAADYAQAFFDGRDNINIAGTWCWRDSTTIRDGVKTVALGGDEPDYYEIDVEDSLFSQEEQTPVAITVEYYDEGNGYFSLDYVNAKDAGDQLWNPDDRAVMTDTKTWKTHTFYIDDIVFCDAAYISDTDIRIATWTNKYGFSEEAVYIRSVKFEKVFPQVPIDISMTSEYAGNIFDDGDNKKLNIDLKNISETELNIEFTTQVLKLDGMPVSEKQAHSITIMPRSLDTVQIEVEKNLPFGLYYIEVNLTAKGTYRGEEKNCEITERFDFSVANKREDDEPGNPMLRSMVHTGRIKSGLQPVTMFNMMGEAGISGIRDELLFSQTGAETGTVETPNYQKDICFPKLYSSNQKNNMLILFFDGGGIRDYPKTEEDRKAYTQYIAETVKQNAEYFDYYEIWNEPNLEVFAATRTATAYADIVKLTAPIIRENDPTAKICIFGTAQIPLDYMKQAMDEGVLEYADIVTVHPYDWSGGSGAEYAFRNDYYINRMKELRQVLTDYGKPDMPIISSELGVRSGGEKPFASLTGQAAHLLQMYAMTAGEELSDAIYQYAFVDYSLTGADAVWGFVRNWNWTVPYAAKPSYLMVANFNKLLANAKPTGSIRNDNKTSVYKFRNASNDKDIIVLWTEKGSESIALNLGTDAVQVLDMYGNVKANLSEADGIYDFHSSYEPQYIIGTFSKFEQDKPDITLDSGRVTIPIDDRTIITAEDKQKRNLEAKVYVDGDLELVGQTAFRDGKATFEFYTNPSAEYENEIIFEFYDNGKLVYYTKAHILIGETMNIVTDVQKNDAVSENRYKSVVGITNYANMNEIQGKITAHYSNVLEAGNEKIETRYFDKVKPGETIYVELDIPKQPVKKSIFADAVVELSSGVRYETLLNLNQNISAYMEKPPKMTGPVDYSQWTGGDWCAADDEYAAQYLTDWEGPTDCSLRYKIKWDEDNLYMLALASDNVHYTDATASYMWQVDSLQVALSGIENGKASDQFTELGLCDCKDGTIVYRFSTQGLYNNAAVDLPTNVTIENAEITLEQHDGKYVYRARIPWKEIFGGLDKMTSNTKLAFSVILNDNDGMGRRGWVEYSSGIGNAKDSSLFGITTFVK